MKALLVDGFNLVRRIYAAVPEPPHYDSDDQAKKQAARQIHINSVIESSTRSLQRALKFHQPTHCLAIFEQAGRTWRHHLFADYKNKRAPMPESLASAMPALRQTFEATGVACFDQPDYEANDVIATMATKIADSGGYAIILSTDRNHCQLLCAYISVYDHFGQCYLDRAKVLTKFEVEPNQLPFLLALAGDSGLSIAGIPSIGLRTAARLVKKYQTLDKLLEASQAIPGKIGAKLYNGKQDAKLGLTLFTLKTDIELGINLNQFRYSPA